MLDYRRHWQRVSERRLAECCGISAYRSSYQQHSVCGAISRVRTPRRMSTAIILTQAARCETVMRGVGRWGARTLPLALQVSTARDRFSAMTQNVATARADFHMQITFPIVFFSRILEDIVAPPYCG